MSAIEQHGQGSSKTPRDARVRRTRRALHGALGALLHEKPFEAIAIKQILGRADVARSTFYAHFESKEELLASAIEEAISQAGSASHQPDDALRFALPMLEHIERLRTVGAPTAKMLRFHRSTHETLRSSIRDHVRRDLSRCLREAGRRSAALASDQVASTFIVVLEWWQSSAPELSATEVHRRFVDLVAPALRCIPRA